MLDTLVGADNLQLLFERDDVALFTQVGAKQVREVLNGLFRTLWVAASQRGDRVHAVEQEMRPDAGLQRIDPRRGLHLDVASPLMRYVEISEGECRHDQANRRVAQQKCPRIDGEECHCAGVCAPLRAPDRVGADGDHRNQRRNDTEHGARSLGDAHAPQGWARPT